MQGNFYLLPALGAIFLMAAVAGILKVASWKRRDKPFRFSAQPSGATKEYQPESLKRVALERLLRQYSIEHDADRVLDDEDICNRQFVLVTPPIMQAMEDTMFEFLNGLALSVITNRTVVVTSKDKGRSSPWMPKWAVDIRSLRATWRGHGCTRSKDLSATMLGGRDILGILSCCNSSGEVVMIGVCARAHFFFELNDTLALMPGHFKENVKLLLGVDEYTSYGLLLRSAAVIPPSYPAVISALGRIEKFHTSENMVIIGLHVKDGTKHLDNADKFIRAARQSLEKIVPIYTKENKLPCAILMVSNVNGLFSLADDDGKLLGCSVTFIMRDSTAIKEVQAVGSRLNSSSGSISDSLKLEEISLLSRSDVFVGSKLHGNGKRSEISLLVADMIASSVSSGSSNIYWIGDIADVSDWSTNSPRTYTKPLPAIDCRAGYHEYCLLKYAEHSVHCPRLKSYSGKVKKEVPKSTAIEKDAIIMFKPKSGDSDVKRVYNAKYDFRNRSKNWRKGATAS